MIFSVLTPHEWATLNITVGVLALPILFAKVFSVRAIHRHMAATKTADALAKFNREYATAMGLCLSVVMILLLAGLFAGYKLDGDGEDAPVFFAMAMSVMVVDVAWQAWIFRKAFRESGDAKYLPCLFLHLGSELLTAFVLTFGLLFFWSNLQYLLLGS